jgi:hypothetical protein
MRRSIVLSLPLQLVFHGLDPERCFSLSQELWMDKLECLSIKSAFSLALIFLGKAGLYTIVALLNVSLWQILD